MARTKPSETPEDKQRPLRDGDDLSARDEESYADEALGMEGDPNLSETPPETPHQMSKRILDDLFDTDEANLNECKRKHELVEAATEELAKSSKKYRTLHRVRELLESQKTTLEGQLGEVDKRLVSNMAEVKEEKARFRESNIDTVTRELEEAKAEYERSRDDLQHTMRTELGRITQTSVQLFSESTFATEHRGDYPSPSGRRTAEDRGRAIMALKNVTMAPEDSERFTKERCTSILSHCEGVVDMKTDIVKLYWKESTGSFLVMLHTNDDGDEVELILWEPSRQLFTAMTPAEGTPSVLKVTPAMEKLAVVDEQSFLATLKSKLKVSGILTESSCYKLPE